MERLSLRRTPAAWILSILCLLATAPARAADEAIGKWKLSILAFGSDDLAIIDVRDDGGKPKAVLLDWQKQLLGDVKLDAFKLDGGGVSFDLKGAAVTVRFSGKPDAKVPGEGARLGTVQFINDVFPARLEATRDDKVSPPRANPIIQELNEAVRDHGPKSRVQKIRQLIVRSAGAPSSFFLYVQLFMAASQAQVPADEIEKDVKACLETARPYGEAWVDSVRLKLLQALTTTKDYAESTLEMAQEADKAVAPDAALGVRAALVSLLATAARNAEKPDLAKDAEARSTKLEDELDVEYQAKVIPFKPTPFEGRKTAGANRVAMIELFTGAQCPPCVAADVAFDAVLKSYKPTEVIALQYHLHVPGPDPLTTPDTMARQGYYGDKIPGTPTTIFNGRAEGEVGGPIGAAEEGYNEYRRLIGEILEKKARADVKVTADRQGGMIAIAAEAAQIADSDSPKDGERASTRLALRLALTEESVRYVGANRLRLHHHVVRWFPGGVEGKPLVDGKAKVEAKVDVSDLRGDLEGYLSRAAKKRPFPGPLPAIELKNLRVVAFVQDDADKRILGAAEVAVAEPAP